MGCRNGKSSVRFSNAQAFLGQALAPGLRASRPDTSGDLADKLNATGRFVVVTHIVLEGDEPTATVQVTS